MCHCNGLFYADWLLILSHSYKWRCKDANHFQSLICIVFKPSNLRIKYDSSDCCNVIVPFFFVMAKMCAVWLHYVRRYFRSTNTIIRGHYNFHY